MSGPKPCLGYPSRTAAILGMLDRGLSRAEIADRIGIPLGTVAALECSAARSLGRRAATSPSSESALTASRDASSVATAPSHGRAILIPESVLRALRRAAARRGLTPHELARLLVVTVADNGLVDAVLDDAGEIAQ